MSNPGDLDQELRAILEARTRTLARPVQTEERAPTLSLVVRVAGERYGIDASTIASVAELRHLTPVPHAPPEVAGLTARGGAVMPVFYLRSVLGLELTSLPEYGRVVIVGEGERALALAVDAIEGLEPVDLDALAPPPPSLRAARGLLRGVDASGLAVLDDGALLSDARLVVDVPLPRER
jgi:chemotaxis signal transduction protein